MYIRNTSFANTSEVVSHFTSNPAVAYYVMRTATDTKITNTALVGQLEALNAATLYEGVNNITTTAESGNLPAILDLTYQTWFKGEKGDTGPANSLSIGTVESGATAAASITGTPPNQTLSLTLPKGDPGQNGTDGTDGFSPIATVTKSGDTATITITDKNGTTTATVKDGTTGTTDYEDLTDVYYTDITLQAVWDSVNGYYVITTVSPIRATAPVVGDKIRVQFDTAHTGSAIQIKVNSDSVLSCVIYPVVSSNSDTQTAMTEISTDRVYEFVKTQKTGQSAVWDCLDSFATVGTNQIADAAITPAKIGSNFLAAIGSYSTTEIETPFTDWNGDTIYKKTVDCGALPNSEFKNVPHNVANFKNLVSIDGVAKNPGTSTTLTLPASNPNAGYSVSIAADTTNIQIGTGTDRTAFTETYITIWYTKTS
jgi:hypothetical protein